MTSMRRTALVAGLFYVITFISIPTVTLYRGVKGDGIIVSSISSTAALWGCTLEIIVALAGIGTAVTLFPVVKRQNESMALGLVASRTLEAAMIFAGVASLLSLIGLRTSAASGPEAASLTEMGRALIAFYNATFLLGQSLMPVINALLLGTLLYRSGLVPRVIPLVGLIGAPLQALAVILTLFGITDRVSTATGILVLPIAAWELSLGLYLLIKGFKDTPLTSTSPPATEAPPMQAVVSGNNTETSTQGTPS
jgi:hypothetical protein